MTKTEIQVSSEFRTYTTKAIISIGLFILTYVIMLAFAIVLTFFCVLAGLGLIISYPTFITIVLGIGLASLGVLVLIFLVKFIFKSHRVDRSHLVEIKIHDEPELFNLIKDIVTKVGTSFPKKVYLSPDVNAAVFYDSSFWSMFLPIKKNLQIGLGLVNTVSKAELTAILSHEFGHFSQKTMKVGSYVYNVNQVIFNLLYENESYDKLISRWAKISGYFSIFVVLAIKIVEAIQWVLKLIYALVNKSYMALSREMEFQADEIAASVTGYQPLKSSLLRMTLADHCFNYVLSFYEARIAKNQKSENLYRDQLFVMHFLADDSRIKVENGFPQVTVEDLNKFNKSKLIIKDQWASHPSTEDRIEMLERKGNSSVILEYVPAEKIFADIQRTQEELTSRMFQTIQYSGEASAMSFEEFQNQYKTDFFDGSFPKIYNNYYDNKNPFPFDTKTVKSLEKITSIGQLFSPQKVDLVYTAIALQNDMDILKQIANKEVEVKTFDYDGKKYKRKESQTLISQLDVQLSELNKEIEQNDIDIFHFFRACEEQGSGITKLEFLYEELFDYDTNFYNNYEPYTELSSALGFVQFTTPFEEIRYNFVRIEPIEERLKVGISEILADDIFETEISQDMRDNFELYLSKKWQYFGNEKYFDENLTMLFAAMNDYAFLLSRGYFIVKKRLLSYQEELYMNKK